MVLFPILMLPSSMEHQSDQAEPHPLHLSHANMVLEGRHAIINVRLFQDDLELAMSRFHEIDALRVRPDPIIDSLFTDYFNSKFTLTIVDSIHDGRVVASGQADDMWWYAVTFEAAEEITSVTFRNDLLFDIFDDDDNFPGHGNVGKPELLAGDTTRSPK